MRKTTKMVAVLAAMSVMVLGAATMVSAAEKNGWAKEGSDWYYYVEDKAVKNQWALSDGVWYFLGEHGKMETDAFIDNNVPEVVVEEDVEVIDADLRDYYYVDNNGAMVTGWKEIEVLTEKGPTEGIGKSWYYFGANGLMYGDNWVQSGDAWYYVNQNGRMAKNKLVTDWDGNDYYLDGKGVMITGWYKATDKDDDYHVDRRPDQIVNLEKGDWIYADKNGVLSYQGWQKVGSAWYFFGEVEKASAFSPTASAVSGSAVGESYVMQSEGFITVEKSRKPGTFETFYLTKSGAMETGLFRIVDKRNSDYYFADSDGVIQVGAVQVSGKYYYFSEVDGIRYDHTPRGSAKYLVVDESGATNAYSLSSVTTDAAAKALAGNDVKVYKLGTATMWK